MNKNTKEVIIFFSIGGTIGALIDWRLTPAGIVILSSVVILAITRLLHKLELSPLESFFSEENQIDLYNG